MQKIGINTNNDCGLDFFEICGNIKNSGFESIMIAFIRDKEVKQLEYAKKLGLDISFVHLDNTYTNDMWVKGYAHISQMNVYLKQIELCSNFGVKIAVLHATIGNPNSTVINPNPFGLSEFQKLVDFAESRNVMIALENVDSNGYPHFQYLLNNIKSNNFGFCYDAGHHNLYNKNIDLLTLYGDRLLAIHLHDNLGDYEFGDDYTRDLHLLPFDGNIDYTSIMHRLKEIGYKNTIMIETHKTPIAELNLYKDLTNTQFLTKAKIIAEKLRVMVE